MPHHQPADTPVQLDDTPAELLADVAPTWRAAAQQVHTASKSTSTQPRALADGDAQTPPGRCDASCQASTRSRQSGSHGSSRADGQLPAFLSRTGPAMLAALAANAEAEGRPRAAARGLVQTPASAGASTAGGTDAAAGAECGFTLAAFGASSSSSSSSKPPGGAGGRVNHHKLQVTSLSWSKTGQTLAASFGRHDSRGWCSLSGAVATWTLGRLQEGSAASCQPDRVIDVDSCVLTCAFHPAEPALLAGGTHNGDVVVWDLSRDDADAQVAKSAALSELRHREPVTALSWQHSAGEARRHGSASAAASCRLFSLGADGRLLVWLWGQLGTAPLYGYELRLCQPGAGPRGPLGGCCMAFCPDALAGGQEEAGLLLVGTEGGHLLRCQVGDISEATTREFGAKAAAAAGGQAGGRLELRSAVQDASHQPFAASANGLSSCPHHRQLAVAAGGDGSLRVVDVLRAAPLLQLEPSAGGLLTAGWSPSRPCVFAAGSAAGVVHIFDLAARQRILQPVAHLNLGAPTALAPGPSDKHSSTQPSPDGVNALAFNARAPSLLAAAAGDLVRVWRLPAGLVQPRPSEATLLRRLLEAEDAPGLLRAQGICVAV